MKADYLTYRRATSVSLLGLVIQTLLAVALVVYSVFARDHAAMTAAMAVGLGLPIWLTLAIVFDQHRRERVETLEAERLAEAEGSGSVFEGQTEFRVAAKRVQFLHRFVIPAISLATGAAMIGVGLWRLSQGRTLISPDRFIEPRQRGWAIAIGLALAFVGFVFARYVSGMAKQKVWANLRAGSATAVGAALMGLAIAIGQFIDIAGPNVVLRYLQVAFPVVMIALGAEIFLNFVLDLYRPRKPGELPRPAFDSRLLGFAAAPDRIAKSISDAINYQLGFNVTSGWFYRLLSRSVLLLLILGLGIVWALTALTVVKPHQRAMVLRFGKPVGEIGPGLHFKAPWPIDRVEIPVQLRKDDRTGRFSSIGRTTTGVRTIELGTAPPTADGPVLWTNEHAREEIYQLVQPSRAGSEFAPGSEQARAVAMVAIEIPMQYAVRDVLLYEQLAAPDLRDDLLRWEAQREIVRHLSGTSIDDVVGGRCVELAKELKGKIEAAFAAMNPGPDGKPRGAGVEVLSVSVMRAHPPQQVAASYERVVQAEQNRQAKIQAAEADEIETLTSVVGSVDLANKIVGEIDSLQDMRDGVRAKTATADQIRGQELKIQQLIESAGGRAAATVAQARAERWTRHMRERGRAARYEGQLAAYEASPSVYQASLYFDALRDVFAKSRLYVTTDAVKLHIRTELQDRESGVDVFNPNIGKPAGEQ